MPCVKTILDLSGKDAKMFFFKHESYFNADIPHYIRFDRMLQHIDSLLRTKPLKERQRVSPKKHEGVNYKLYSNKNGKYDWRPLELIHPAIYVSLVDIITEQTNWDIIQIAFREYAKDPRISCHSLPVISPDSKKDKAHQVRQWWEDIEQQSIELSLQYDYVFHTDIADCYGSIYTHSIAWALHGKEISKENIGDKSLIGNVIDQFIQSMRYGQTNGIPPGSVLMDFIAEMILGYADTLLSQKLKESNSKDFKILRYRDDYRIFVNNPQDGEIILKTLTEVLIDLGMKLNAQKTFACNDIITGSIKPDKLAALSIPKRFDSREKQLLAIYQHSRQHPNSGSLSVLLFGYYRTMKPNNDSVTDIPIISILAEIAFRNPKVLTLCISIMSKMIAPSDMCTVALISNIRNKFNKAPNTGFCDIWLQRLTWRCENVHYDEQICKVVDGNKIDKNEIELWDNSWISCKALKKALNTENIVNRKILERMTPIIQENEFALFYEY
ncbi:MAG: RNA-directed DNA polymerase [Candidatus Cloacimonetes bacterium]|nr:RNA-directed DNA polymerase [Candidatus Cloacimonadota bacterium]